MQTPIVISHKDCWDGAAAAWAASIGFGCKAEYLFCAYGKNVPSLDYVAGREVYILDFSFPRETLIEMNKVAKSLVVLDHHHTSKQDLEGLDFCEFDMERSGCQMAWDYFFPGVARPKAIDYIGDRDIWKFQMPHSKEVAATLVGTEPTMEAVAAYNRLLDDSCFTETVARGQALLAFFERIYEVAAKRAFPVTMFGKEVLFCESAQILTSELGNYLAKKSPSNISCVYSVGPTGVTMSLRSVNDVDATPIAKAFGGGGHKAACGCKVSLDTFTKMISK